MHDKRVQKGNTYAAMVIPAGSYPDTFNGSQTAGQASASKRGTKSMNSTTMHVSNFQITSAFEASEWEGL